MDADGTSPKRPALDAPARLAELRRLEILDTPPEADYDAIATLAAAVCRSDVAAVNFVDDTRHFTKAIIGMPEAAGGSVANDVSFCAATVVSPDGLLVVPDTRADDRWREHPLVQAGPRVGFYAGAAIVSRGQRVGVVCAFGPEPREITEQERNALITLAEQTAGHLQMRHRNAELRDLAVTDALTGLANRTLLLERLQPALERRRTGDGEVGVLFCDIDDFKRVNDELGHQAGDELLCAVAQALLSATRGGDTVARIAGDEFVVVCPQLAGREDLDRVVERIATATERIAAPVGAPRLSVGAVIAEAGEDVQSVLRRADTAMYAVKPGRVQRPDHA